jgi:hypothetical protein
MSVLTMSAPKTATAVSRLAFTSICLYVAAYLATIMLHETAHAVVSWLLGGRPVQYNTWVRNTNPALATTAELYVALAGPLFSLGQGLLLLRYSFRTRQAGNWPLLRLYAGVFGLMNFLGYVVIGPVAHSGDSGQIMTILHVPLWLQWSLALLAFAALNVLIQQTGPLFLRQLPPATQADEQQRVAGLQVVLQWPWVIGSLVLVVLSLPSPLLALLYIPLVPMVLRRAYRSALKQPITSIPATQGQLQLQWVVVAVPIVLASLYRYFAMGIAW